MKNFYFSTIPVRIQQVVVALTISILLTISFVAFVFAEPIHTRLNPDLVEGGRIYYFKTSPDGNYVVYFADQDTVGKDEIYVVPTDGGTVIKLSGQPVGGSGGDIDFTPDSKYIIYEAKQESDGFYAFHRVPITGGTSINLSGIPPEQAYPLQYKISPDGRWLVFTYERRRSDGGFWEFALMSTPTDRSEPATLKLLLSESDNIHRFMISPDSKRIIYTITPNDLYSVPIEGGESIKLNHEGEPVSDFIFAPSGTGLLYSIFIDGKRYIYRASITGGESTVIGGSKAGSLSFENSFSPYGYQLLTMDNQMNTSHPPYTATYQLYATPLDGGEPLLLSSTSETEGTDTYLGWAQYLSDGSGVIFSLNQIYGGEYAYYVPASGGVKTKLIGPFDFDSFRRGYFFMLTANVKNVLHIVPNPSVYSRSLLETDIASNTTITLATVAEYNTAYDFYVGLSPDGNDVFYSGQSAEGSPIQVFSVSLSDASVHPLTIPSTLNVYYSPSIILHGSQICLVYKLGDTTTYNSKPRDLYSSCYEANWTNRAYLPALSR